MSLTSLKVFSYFKTDIFTFNKYIIRKNQQQKIVNILLDKKASVLSLNILLSLSCFLVFVISPTPLSASTFIMSFYPIFSVALSFFNLNNHKISEDSNFKINKNLKFGNLIIFVFVLSIIFFSINFLSIGAGTPDFFQLVNSILSFYLILGGYQLHNDVHSLIPANKWMSEYKNILTSLLLNKRVSGELKIYIKSICEPGVTPVVGEILEVKRRLGQTKKITKDILTAHNILSLAEID